MEVPEAVLKAAAPLIEMFGQDFDFLGEYEGQQAWLFKYPEDEEVGFPSVFLLKEGKVLEVSGFVALDIVRSFSGE